VGCIRLCDNMKLRVKTKFISFRNKGVVSAMTRVVFEAFFLENLLIFCTVAGFEPSLYIFTKEC